MTIIPCDEISYLSRRQRDKKYSTLVALATKFVSQTILHIRLKYTTTPYGKMTNHRLAHFSSISNCWEMLYRLRLIASLKLVCNVLSEFGSFSLRDCGAAKLYAYTLTGQCAVFPRSELRLRTRFSVIWCAGHAANEDLLVRQALVSRSDRQYWAKVVVAWTFCSLPSILQCTNVF